MNLQKLDLLNFQGIIKIISVFILALIIFNCANSSKLVQIEDKKMGQLADSLAKIDYFNDLDDYFNDSDYFNNLVITTPPSTTIDDPAFKIARIKGERRKAILAVRAKRKARRDSARLAERQKMRLKIQPSFTTLFPVNGSSLDRFLWSLGMFESDGRYSAYNPSGAYGKYQFMPKTWYYWANKYARNNGIPLASVISQTPKNQERVARFKAQTLFGRYGNWGDIASYWFTGKPYTAFRNPWSINDGRTSLPTYMQAIINGMSITKK